MTKAVLDDDPVYLTDEAAPIIRSNPRTMERWRVEGRGPDFIKLGHRVGYRASALKAFLDRQTRTHTKKSGAR